MSFYMNFGAINEGEQAEAYLKRKQERINSERENDKNRYGSVRVTNSDGDKGYQSGSRSTQEPSWDARNNGNYKNDEDRSKESNKDHDYVKRNPKYSGVEERRNRMAELQKKYPDAMPKNTRNSKDDEYDKAVEKRNKELDYANKVAHKYADKNASAYRPGEYQIATADYAKAADAARRHYRRTHKHECGIFAETTFIDE